MNTEIRRYIDNLEPGRKEKLEIIHAMILDVCPKVRQSMKYKMPTYECGDQWVAVANQKHALSIYGKAALLIEEYTKKYPEINAGKACLRFRDTQPIDYIVLKQIMQNILNDG